jgi:hypothetical protein
MIGNKFIAIMTVLAAVLCASLVYSTFAGAAEVVPGDKSLIEANHPGEDSAPAEAVAGSEAESHVPKSPIRFNTVDYQDTGEGSGKLKLAGTALSGSDLYLYFDEQPFAKVVPDSEGKWAVEGELKLDDGRHTFRAEQYDEATRILAGRAMVAIERAKPNPEDAAKGQAAPAEPATPQATTP